MSSCERLFIIAMAVTVSKKLPVHLPLIQANTKKGIPEIQWKPLWETSGAMQTGMSA